jgi:cation:H+ antiporter
MNDSLALILGFVCAGAGGELFVRGIVDVARATRVPPGIVAVTLAAFATSSPELTVAISAALAGTPEISLGDALGSNVVNVALILGLTAVIAAIRTTPRDGVQRDFPAALLVPLLLAALAYDGTLSRADGVALLVTFMLWLTLTIIEAWKRRSAAETVLGETRPWLAATQCVLGLGLLVAAGRLIVVGGLGIGTALGLDTFVVGATLVAVGTSIPELATALISRWRGHDEVGLGTILGSNIFNGLFIVGVAATMAPIRIAWNDVAVSLLFGLVTVAVVFPGRGGAIGRGRGLVLLVLYVGYVLAVL